MSHPKTGMKERGPYDDILANYTAYVPDRLHDQKSTIQKDEFSSKVHVTHALKSGKCGVGNRQILNLSSNRCP